ncbi:MAG: DUF1570 domain-containing protein [Phycisphaerae bacterium]
MRDRRIIAAAVVLFVGLAVPATLVRAAGRGWPMRREGDVWAVQTPHYILHTDHEPEVAQLIAAQQEALFRELYSRMGKIKPTKLTGRFKIKVFQSQGRYLKELGPGAIGSQGMYMHHKDLLAAWGPPEYLEIVLETLRHEGTHQFVMHFIGDQIPIWLNEGMAVFYQHSRFKDGRLELGEVPPKRVLRLKEAIKGHKVIHLGRMLRMSHMEWLNAVHMGGSHAGLQYDQAWAMVHFLAFAGRQRYRGPFTQFIYYISRGREPYRAWEQTFGTNFTAFEERWMEYIQGLEAFENLPCRERLQVLALLVLRFHKKHPEALKDIGTFRKALIEGTLGHWTMRSASGLTFKHDDPEGIALLFRCPADVCEKVDTSYELVPGKGGSPPVIRCSHHVGYMLQTHYERDSNEGAFSVKVITKPNLSKAGR